MRCRAQRARPDGALRRARAPDQVPLLSPRGLAGGHFGDSAVRGGNAGQRAARHSLGENPNADLKVRLKCAASGNPQRAPIADTD